jgi:hypothetical protein
VEMLIVFNQKFLSLNVLPMFIFTSLSSGREDIVFRKGKMENFNSYIMFVQQYFYLP